MIVACAGALVILAGIVLTAVQLVVSIRQRERRRDTTGDPWNGRTLEWATRSPPPEWNFAVLPRVEGLDAFDEAKRCRGGALATQDRAADGAFEMPRPSAIGVVLAFFAFVAGFALVWHITWLALAGLAGFVAACAVRAWNMDTTFERSVADVPEPRP